MLKAGNFTCEEHITIWNVTLILFNCYQVVLQTENDELFQDEDKTCLETCAPLNWGPTFLQLSADK